MNYKKYKIKTIIAIVIALVIFTSVLGKNILTKYNKTPIMPKKVSMKRIYFEESKLGEENVVSGYDKLYYVLNYTLEAKDDSDIKRDITIDISLKEEDSIYANLEEINENNITSELLDNKTLRVNVNNVKTNEEQTLKFTVNVHGAPNGYEILPTVSINEADYKITGEKVEVKTTSVIGNVINKVTKEKLKNVQVSLCKLNSSNICESERITYTTEDGVYSFSDITEGNYKINVLGNYKITNDNFSLGNGSNNINLEVEEVENNIKITKYMKEVTVITNNDEKTYTFDKSQKVKVPASGSTVKGLKVLYGFEITNNGEKDGYINSIKENIPEGMELDKNYLENSSWTEGTSVLYNNSLNNEIIKPNETKTLTIKLQTKNGVNASNYINKVSISEKDYHTVKYVVNGEVVRSLSVQDFDKATSYEYNNNNFKVTKWFSDIELTKEFDFNSEIEKDTLIFGKIEKLTDNENENDGSLTPSTSKNKTEAIVKIMNGNEEYYKKTVKIGEKITRPEADPIKKGYTFSGWYEINLDGTFKDEEYDFSKGITENLTLYAKYKINKYDITFINDESEVLNLRQKVEFDKHVIEPEENLTKTDYNFKGWYEKEASGEYKTVSFDFDNTIVEKNIILYAKWEKKQYRIEFYDTDMNTPINEKTLYDIDSDIDVPTPKNREGYIFEGWYELTKAGQYKNKSYTFIDGKVTKSVKLYAKFVREYRKITFSVNDESYVTKNVELGTKIPVPTNPELEYFEFKYWSLEKDGEEFDFDNYEVSEDVTLYAVFTKVKFQVILHNIDVITTKKVNIGTILTTPKVSYTGHTFKYWSPSENGEEYDLLSNPITSDIEIYAVYETNKYNVNFYDEEDNLGTIEVEFASKIKENDIPDVPTKEGKKLAGWKIKDKNGDLRDFSLENIITKDIDLYAYYAPFESGIVYHNEFDKTYIEEVEKGEYATPREVENKEGYTFKYWSETPDGSVPFDFQNTVINDIVDLYAVYNAKKINVTFMNQTSESLYEEYEVTETSYNKTATLPNSPSKEGYTFLYWSTEKNGEAFDLTQKLKEDLILYAVYEKTKYTVTLNLNGGLYDGNSENQIFKLTIDETKELLIPTKEYSKFTNWTIEGNATIEKNILTMGKGNVILTANYEVQKYKVEFIDDNNSYLIEEIEYNKTVSMPFEPKKEGYIFLGWSLEEEKVENRPLYDFNTKITENITLYAVYQIKTYTVTYMNKADNYGYYNGFYKTLKVNHGETAKYYDPEVLGLYKGWSTTASSQVEYDFNTPVTSDLILYPIADTNKTVTYMSLNENGIYENIKTVSTSDSYYSTSLEPEITYIPDGYKFTYFSLSNPKETSDYTKYEGGRIESNITLYAVFELAERTVTYKLGEDLYYIAEVVNNTTLNEDQIPENPTSNNEKFIGWYLNDELFDFNTPITNSITLVAKFEEIKEPIISLSTEDFVSSGLIVTIDGINVEYKIGNGEYQEYKAPFTLNVNTTITARAQEDNLYSKEVTKEVTNIDTVKPELTIYEFNNVSNNNLSIILKAKDEMSGIKTLNVYINENTSAIYTKTYENEKTIDEIFEINELNSNEEYNFRVEITDAATNTLTATKSITTLEEKEKNVKITQTNDEVLSEALEYQKLQSAIDYCGSLKCKIELQKDINESVEVLDGANIILDLNNKSITGIRDYAITNNGNLTILNETNLPVKTSTIYSSDIAIKNNETGYLIVGNKNSEIDNDYIIVEGTNTGLLNEGIVNYYDGTIKGIVSINDKGVINTPEAYSISSVNENNVQISTLTNQIANYEARINNNYYTKLKTAIDSASDNQTVTVLKNIILDNQITVEDNQNISLDLNGFEVNTNSITDINEEDAVLVNNGELKITDSTDIRTNPEIDTETHNIDLATVSNEFDSDLNYSFDYIDGKLVSNNKGIETTSNNRGEHNNDSWGYIPIDLRDKTTPYMLTVNASISSNPDTDNGIIYVSDINYTRTGTGRRAYSGAYSKSASNGIVASISGISTNDYNNVLNPGNLYYVHFIYTKNGSNNFYEENKEYKDTFTINNVKIKNLTTNEENNIELTKFTNKVTSLNKFNYEDGKLISENIYKNGDNTSINTSNSAYSNFPSSYGVFEIDLENYTGIYDLNVNYTISNFYGPDTNYIYVLDKRHYYEENLSYLETPLYSYNFKTSYPTEKVTEEKSFSLEAGKKYYLILNQVKMGYTDYSNQIQDGTLIINNINYKLHTEEVGGTFGNSSSSNNQIINNGKLNLESGKFNGNIINNSFATVKYADIKNNLTSNDSSSLNINNGKINELTSINSSITINGGEIANLNGSINLTGNSGNINNLTIGNNQSKSNVNLFDNITINNLNINNNTSLVINGSKITNIKESTKNEDKATIKNEIYDVKLTSATISGNIIMKNVVYNDESLRTALELYGDENSIIDIDNFKTNSITNIKGSSKEVNIKNSDFTADNLRTGGSPFIDLQVDSKTTPIFDNVIINTTKNSYSAGQTDISSKTGFKFRNSAAKLNGSLASYNFSNCNIEIISSEIKMRGNFSTNTRNVNYIISDSEIIKLSSTSSYNNKFIDNNYDSNIEIKNSTIKGYENFFNNLYNSTNSFDSDTYKIYIKNSNIVAKPDSSVSQFMYYINWSYSLDISDSTIKGFNKGIDISSTNSNYNNFLKSKINILNSTLDGDINSKLDVSIKNSNINGNITTSNDSSRYPTLNIDNSNIIGGQISSSGPCYIGVNDGVINNEFELNINSISGSNINYYDGIITTKTASGFVYKEIPENYKVQSEAVENGIKHTLVSIEADEGEKIYRAGEKEYSSISSILQEMEDGVDDLTVLDLKEFKQCQNDTEKYKFVYADGKLESNNRDYNYGNPKGYIPIDLSNNEGEYIVNIKVLESSYNGSVNAVYGVISERDDLIVGYTIGGGEELNNPSFVPISGQIPADREELKNQLTEVFIGHSGTYSTTLQGGKKYYLYIGADGSKSVTIDNISYGKPRKGDSSISEIELIKDGSYNEQIITDNNLTLDLNGHNLTMTPGSSLNSNGSLEILNSKEIESKIIGNQEEKINGKSLKINNVVLENVGLSSINDLNIINSKIESLKTSGNALVKNSDVNGTIEVSAGNLDFINSNLSSSDIGVFVRGGASANIISGNITSTSTAIMSDGTLTIGTKDDEILSTPQIYGNEKGINIRSGTINYYDGEITSLRNKSINGVINDTPNGYRMIKELSSDGSTETTKLTDRGSIINERTNKDYHTVNEAINEANDEDVLLLDTDYLLKEKIINDKNITINLNGFNFNNNSSEFIDNNGTLKFITENSTEEINNLVNNITINNNGSLSFENIKIPKGNLVVNNNGELTTNTNIIIKNSEIKNITINNGKTNILSSKINVFVNSSELTGSKNEINRLTNNYLEELTLNDMYISKLINNGIIVFSKNYNTDKTSEVINNGTLTYDYYNLSSLSSIINNENAILNINSAYSNNSITEFISNKGILNIEDTNLSSKEITNDSTGNMTLRNSDFYQITNNGVFIADTIKVVSVVNNKEMTVIRNNKEKVINEIYNSSTGVLTIDGKVNEVSNSGKVTTTENAYVSSLTSSGNFIMNGGTITGAELSGTVNKTGGNFEGRILYSSDNDIDLGVLSKRTDVYIYSSTAQITIGENSIIGKLYNKNQNLNLDGIEIKDRIENKGGNINIGTNPNINSVTIIRNGIENKGGIITLGINDGNYDPKIIQITGGIDNYEDNPTLNYYDGTIKSKYDYVIDGNNPNIPEGLLIDIKSITEEEIFVMTLSESGKIEDVVSINDVNHRSLKAALESITDYSNTITIDAKKDMLLDSTLIIPENANIVINLNGKTITGSYKEIVNNGILTIIGDGNINVEISNNNTLNLNNLKCDENITNSSAANLNLNSSVINETITGNAKKITIDDSEIHGLDGVQHLILNSGSVFISSSNTLSFILTMNGGTINSYDPISIIDGSLLNGGKVDSVKINYADISTNIDINNIEFTKLNILSTNNVSLNNITGSTLSSSSDSLIVRNSILDKVSSSSLNTVIENSTVKTSISSNSENSVTILNSEVSEVYYPNGTVTLGENVTNLTNRPIVNGNLSAKTLNYYDGVINMDYDSTISAQTINIPIGYTMSSKYAFVSNNVIKRYFLEKKAEELLGFVIENQSYSNMQSAIDSCSANESCNITLYSNETLNSNVIIPDDKTVSIDYNGHTLSLGEYTVIGNITEYNGSFINQAMNNLGASIKNFLNIKDSAKTNIVVFSLDDGSDLSELEKYDLLVKKHGKYSKIKVENIVKDAAIYIDNLNAGSYKLTNNKGKVATFEVLKNGDVIGSASRVFNVDDKTKNSSAQMVVDNNRNLLILSGLVIILISLFALTISKKKKVVGN